MKKFPLQIKRHHPFHLFRRVYEFLTLYLKKLAPEDG